MAKEVAIGKRAKISEAQQYMLLAVLGASVVLGASASLISHFVQQISFNTKVIMEEEKSIADYSNVIQNAGICKKPSGSIYSDNELENCHPESIEVSEIPDTLRAEVLGKLASNEALNSVPKESSADCTDSKSGKAYTYDQLMEEYRNARSDEGRQAASNRIKSCSALRIIPDALPSFKNESALMASLNKLFIESNWTPESISPSGDSELADFGNNLYTMSVGLSVESDIGTTTRVLSNIERSIREFDIKSAHFEWDSNNSLILQAQATAYYMDKSSIAEATTTINPGDK